MGKKENAIAFTEPVPVHISTYPMLLAKKAIERKSKKESQEGGPGSGIYDRPTHTKDYFPGGRPNTLGVDNQIARTHNNAFFDKRPMTDEEKKRVNDLEFERRKMLTKSVPLVKSGGALKQKNADSGSSFPGQLRGKNGKV